jgi:hypothetical protein
MMDLATGEMLLVEAHSKTQTRSSLPWTRHHGGQKRKRSGDASPSAEDRRTANNTPTCRHGRHFALPLSLAAMAGQER